MTTIQISYKASTPEVEQIKMYLADVRRTNPNWNGASFKIKQGDYTCIPHDHSPEAVNLLREIQSIMERRVG